MLPLGVPISDYLDVLIDPEAPGNISLTLAAELARRAEWHSCEWPELKPQASAMSLPCPADCRDSQEPAQSCPVLRLPGSPDALTEIIPAGKRRDVRQSYHRIARRGRMCIVPLMAFGVERAVAELVRLHQARWAGRGGGVLGNEQVIKFHRTAMPGLMAAGVLRVYLLELAGRVAAVYYGFMHANTAYAYLGGFDPMFAFESPGTVLLYHAIREATREGAQQFDFLRGREAYKYTWGATDRWNARRIFRRRDGRC